MVDLPPPARPAGAEDETMSILRKIADLIGRIRRLFRREPPPRVVLFVADDNRVYWGLVSGGEPLATLSRTSAGPCVMRFTRV